MPKRVGGLRLAASLALQLVWASSELRLPVALAQIVTDDGAIKPTVEERVEETLSDPEKVPAGEGGVPLGGTGYKPEEVLQSADALARTVHLTLGGHAGLRSAAMGPAPHMSAHHAPTASPEKRTRVFIAAAIWCAICVMAFALTLQLVTTWAPVQKQKNGPTETNAIVMMTAFRFYGGFYMCTWLPYILTHESAAFWDKNQSLMMSAAKAIVGVTLACLPMLGYFNDRTVHWLGRRRIWYAWGFVLVCLGVTLAALVSSQREAIDGRLGSGAAGWFYLLTVLVWSIGEACADSTSEALIPDVCTAQDFNRGAAARSVAWFAGGLTGYVAVVVVSNFLEEPFHWFYVLYLITVCASSPWAMWYCAPWPGEAERCRAARAADEAAGTNTWTVAWVESYWSIFTVSRDFELMCCATFVWAGAASGYSWLLLVLRDVVQIEDEAERTYHFSLMCVCGLLTATVASAVFGAADIPTHLSYRYVKLAMILYAITDFFVPIPYFVSDHVPTRLIVLYIVTVCKGGTFGLTMTMQQNCFWLEIPRRWREGVGAISRGMAFQGVCRTTGGAFGNTLAGLLLHFAGLGWGMRKMDEQSKDAMSRDSYPVQGYVIMQTFSIGLGLFAVWLVWNVTAEGKTALFDLPAPIEGPAEERAVEKWETLPKEEEAAHGGLEPEPESESENA